jgi:hypothetical protein
MTSRDFIELAIQGLIALGTISIAVLAVWGDWFRSRLASPKLRINLRDPLGELTKFQNGTPVRYYHIRVSNQRAWVPARNTRILVRSLSKPAPDGTFLEETQVSDLQLTWRYPQLGTMYRTIGPEEFCDLGSVTKDGFRLTTYVIPNNFTRVIVQQGKLRAEILAVADNGYSQPLHVEISWDGQWDDGAAEMSRHLMIKETSVGGPVRGPSA